MKGGNIKRLCERRFSFTLGVLAFTTIFLWSWEKSPFVTTLLSGQDQFIMPSSDIHTDEYDDPPVSLKAKEHDVQEYPDSRADEGTENGDTTAGSDAAQINITDSNSLDRKDNDMDSASSFSKKSPWPVSCRMNQ